MTSNETTRVHEISGRYTTRMPILETNFNRRDWIELRAFLGQKQKFLITTKYESKGTIDRIIEKLEEMAIQANMLKYQMFTTDKLFEQIEPENFKKSCTEILQKTTIVLIKPAKHIMDKNKRKILQQCDVEVGHKGRTKLYVHMKQEYYWHKMSSHVAQHVKNCVECKLKKLTITTTL